PNSVPSQRYPSGVCAIERMKPLENPSMVFHALCAYWLTSRDGFSAKADAQHERIMPTVSPAFRRTVALFIIGTVHSIAGNSTAQARRLYASMMPFLSPMTAACVRSLAPSFDRMFLTCPFTASSVMASLAAISLLDNPPAINVRTRISDGESAPS